MKLWPSLKNRIRRLSFCESPCFQQRKKVFFLTVTGGYPKFTSNFSSLSRSLPYRFLRRLYPIFIKTTMYLTKYCIWYMNAPLHWSHFRTFKVCNHGPKLSYFISYRSKWASLFLSGYMYVELKKPSKMQSWS